MDSGRDWAFAAVIIAWIVGHYALQIVEALAS
jgi:hypothetical protein